MMKTPRKSGLRRFGHSLERKRMVNSIVFIISDFTASAISWRPPAGFPLLSPSAQAGDTSCHHTFSKLSSKSRVVVSQMHRRGLGLLLPSSRWGVPTHPYYSPNSLTAWACRGKEGKHYISQVDSELVVLLPQLHEYWGVRFGSLLT